MEEQAKQFVDFVLRHTWPERAKAHGFKAVYDIIRHHPFAKLFASPIHEIKPPSDTAEGLLREAASKFRFYQSQHEDKYRSLFKQRDELTSDLEIEGIERRMSDTHEKARVNADIASRIEVFLR